MRVGGGNERWMVLLPVFVLTLLATVLLGGPANAMSVAERALYDAWGWIEIYLRR